MVYWPEVSFQVEPSLDSVWNLKDRYKVRYRGQVELNWIYLEKHLKVATDKPVL